MSKIYHFCLKLHFFLTNYSYTFALHKKLTYCIFILIIIFLKDVECKVFIDYLALQCVFLDIP